MFSSTREMPRSEGGGMPARSSIVRLDAPGDSWRTIENRGMEEALEMMESPGPWSTLSVVVPAKNEANSLPQLIEEVVSALRPLCVATPNHPQRLGGFEIVIVNDGSTDATPLVLESLRDDYPELSPLTLASNVGQSAATAAGFRAARGTWIATLDADLQNDPADLAKLWEALPGHDAALGWRTARRDVWSKRVISRWANRIRNRVLGQAIRDTGCSVRIFPRSMALRLPMFRGSHRFLGPLLLREGCRLIQVPVNHRQRSHGRSHYGFRNRSIKVIVDLFGVAWLMRRPVRYDVVPFSADGFPRNGTHRVDVASQGIPAMHDHASASAHSVSTAERSAAALPASAQREAQS